ncbi:hypothetical protein [Oceanisphaera psychrotolerans]|uniref:Flagellar protein FliT n=1 Tax=Oceanisphaera psychrotolerans TaxID=1414654 RepID=A0A1J4QCA2_9GAMM|nr:hypothetical protein [Oceanisphaera psychrotolerans]OIN07719.1 hypothetical protein BFR47_03695 [Oceanisphaera psychrotolerans]
MSPLEQLQALDQSLLAEFADPEQLQAETMGARLAERARLLRSIIESKDTETFDAGQVAELVERSRRLIQEAEHGRTLLAEKLAGLKKGRRSVRAYQNVKRN